MCACACLCRYGYQIRIEHFHVIVIPYRSFRTYYTIKIMLTTPNRCDIQCNFQFHFVFHPFDAIINFANLSCTFHFNILVYCRFCHRQINAHRSHLSNETAAHWNVTSVCVCVYVCGKFGTNINKIATFETRSVCVCMSLADWLVQRNFLLVYSKIGAYTYTYACTYITYTYILFSLNITQDERVYRNI